MKKALVIVAILGMVAVANGEYRLWFTGTQGLGLSNTALISHPSQAITSDDTVPNYTNNQDAYAGYNPVTFPNYTTTGAGQNCTNPLMATGWAYIWGQFYGEANGAKIITANMEIRNCLDNSLFPGDVVWYKMDQKGQPGARKRWDGASTEADNYATFRNAAQTLVAVTANGIVNVGASNNTENWNMWSKGANDGATGRISLIGAVNYTSACHGAYTFVIPLSGGTPNFVISSVPTWPIVGAIMPEPASMLLISLAGLLIRRR